MSGLKVIYFGRLWLVLKLNYLGDWSVVRYNPDRKTWSRSSIAFGLEPSHPHFAEVIPQSARQRRKQAAALRNVERLIPHLNSEGIQGRRFRRARMWSAIVKRYLA